MLHLVAEVVGDLVGNLLLMAADRIRPSRGPTGRLAKAHPRSVVRRVKLASWPGLTRVGASEVWAVVADGEGLSFRDRYDVELLGVSSDDIVSLTIVDEAGGFIRLTRRTGQPIEFWVNGRHGVQPPAREDLAQALGTP